MTRGMGGMLLMCVAITVCASPAYAILTEAVLLVTPLHARANGIGEVGVADNSDPSTIFFNPANVCAASRVYATASQLNADIGDDAWFRSGRAGFSWQSKTSSWTVGFDAAYTKFTLGDFAVDYQDSLIANVEYYQDVLAFSLGAGFRAGGVYDFRLGAGVERWRAHYPDYGGPVEEANAAAFNAGFGFAVHERYGAWNIVPALGASIMDMGDDVEWESGVKSKLPRHANFGASVRVESAPCDVLSARVPLLAVIAQVDGIKPSDGDFEWGIGNEIAVAQIFFVRTGVHRYATRGDSFFNTTSETRSSWGVGLGLPAGPLRARLDYGRRPPANFAAIGGDGYYLSALVEWTF